VKKHVEFSSTEEQWFYSPLAHFDRTNFRLVSYNIAGPEAETTIASRAPIIRIANGLPAHETVQDELPDILY
jgi:hypothetical protein